MATFETLPHFEASWRKLTREQQATFHAVVLEAFEPDLMTPDRPFRRILRVKPVAGYPGLFEMTWDHNGRATFSYDPECEAGQPHVVWQDIVTIPRSSR
jgi:hypothetical protein